ncbi:hypothetical protein ZWY2020_056168 [Hordeum vulgare]|nr:hypothetical protein ZWY2020_056168 [Hordeum vulgare]
MVEDGGVADIYVEYNGEEDEREETDSGSDFEDELDEAMNMGSEEEPDAVITSEEPCVIMTTQEPDHILNATEHILVPDVGGVITQVISSPLKQNVKQQKMVQIPVSYPSESSQVVDPTQPCEATQNGSDSEESEDYEYVPHSEDSGEESEVVEMRKHARTFRKKKRDSKMWADTNATGAVPIDLVANVEEVVEDMEFESSDEDYSYDEDEDGNMHAQTDASTSRAAAARASGPTNSQAATRFGVVK